MESVITTPAAQVIISIIPIVGIVVGGVLLFFALLWHHLEVKRRIQTNNFNPPKFDWESFSLLAGLLLTGVGFVLTILFILLEGKSYALLGGLIPLATGLMLMIYYKIKPNKKKMSDE